MDLARIQTYDEGGRGKKQCPACNRYVGARNSVCACGHEFIAGQSTREEEDKEVQTYDEGGRGKKQCPACNKFIGARNGVCACGHEFQTRRHEPIASEPVRIGMAQSTVLATSDDMPRRRFGNSIGVPAGECPHRLTGTSLEEVKSWGDKVRATYEHKNQHLSMNGLMYYVRYFYDFHSDDHETVAQHILELYAGRD